MSALSFGADVSHKYAYIRHWVKTVFGYTCNYLLACLLVVLLLVVGIPKSGRRCSVGLVKEVAVLSKPLDAC